MLQKCPKDRFLTIIQSYWDISTPQPQNLGHTTNHVTSYFIWLQGSVYCPWPFRELLSLLFESNVWYQKQIRKHTVISHNGIWCQLLVTTFQLLLILYCISRECACTSSNGLQNYPAFLPSSGSHAWSLRDGKCKCFRSVQFHEI